MKVTLNAHLGRTRLSLGELLALQEGDILRLDRGPSDLVDVRVEGVVKYEAHPMGRGGNHAIEVVRKMAVPSVARNMAAPVQHTHLPEGEDTMTQSGEEAEGASDE